MPEFTTARLRLRAFTHADAAFIVALLNDPDWLRYIGDRKIHSTEAACRYIDGIAAMQAEFGVSLLAVEPKQGGAVLGMCGLIRRPELADVDLGFAFLPAARGRGYATEAAAATLARAFTQVGLARVVAFTDPANAGSGIVLTRIGMRYEGLRPHGGEPVAFYVAER